MEKKLIIRETRRSYDAIVRFLRRKAGYQSMNLLARDETPIQSKKAWFVQGLQASVQMLRRICGIREAEKIIMIGNYSALFLLLLNRLHMITPRKIFWWAFFIHSEKAQKLLKTVFRVLYLPNVQFIVFSKYEGQLYDRTFGLPSSAFVYIPYGDWKQAGTEESTADAETRQAGEYYFAGGYTNRDYQLLLDCWESIDKKLVIIGSENNADLVRYQNRPDRNPRVRILLDTSSEEFDRYLRGARACILPFRADTGASGQTVALRCMRLKKLMIASYTSAMTEYIMDGRTGYLLRDLRKQLPGTIAELENDPARISRMITEQTRLYETTFSYEKISQTLLKVF